MKKPLIVFTRRIPGGVVEEFEKKYEVRVGSVGVLPRKKLLRIVRGAYAIVSVLTEKIDGEVMDAAGPNLKIIANYAVGFDNIDWGEAKKRGIFATNTPSNLGDAVAEFAVTLMTAVARRLVDADIFMRGLKYQGWDPSGFLGQDLSGKTVGVLGLGRIGSVIAKRAQAVYDMKVLYTQRHQDKEFEKDTGAKFAKLETLLKESDVVVVAVPLTKETYHMIGREEFLKMKKTAILINIARGPIVSERALIWALQNKVIWGAGLDVFENELNIGLDYMHRRTLLRLPNVIMTPHIASATIVARDEMASMVAKNVEAVLGGKKPPNLVWK